MSFDEILWRIRNEPEWVILIGLLLVIVLGGGGYYLYQRSVSQENQKKNFVRSLTRYNLAERTGNYQAAAQGLSQYVNRYPGSPQVDIAIFFLGKSYLKVNQPTQAIKQFRRILNNHPDSLFRDSARLHIGYAQLERGNSDLALRQFSQLGKRNESHLWEEAVWQQAIVHKTGGDTESALSALSRLTSRKAGNESFWATNARMMKSSLK